MAVNIGKTKLIIFHNKGKIIQLNDLMINCDDNEPCLNYPRLITQVERYHANHTNPECRAYNLRAELDKHINFIHHTNFLGNKLTRCLLSIRRAKNLLTAQSLKSLHSYNPNIFSAQSFLAAHLNRTSTTLN